MAKIPILAILTIREDLTESNAALIKELIGDTIETRGYVINDFSRQRFDPKADLCLVVGPKEVAEAIIATLHPDVKYLIKKRSVDLTKLHYLENIPAGADVLLVNDLYINALEVVNELNQMNLYPLRLYPYSPEGPEILPGGILPYRRPDGSPFHYAITVGEPHLVPSEIPIVVDIGVRMINIITVADIMRQLKQDEDLDPMVGSRYIMPFVNMNMEMAKKQREISMLQAQLSIIIANIPNGVLLLNEEGAILICNEKAEEILKEASLKGRHIEEFLGKGFSLATEERQFINIHNHMVYITVTEIMAPPQVGKCYLIDIVIMEHLQDIDRNYRKRVRENHKARYRFRDIVYRSSAMRSVIEKAWSFARTDSNILITGESGTGKELLAQAIHNASPREGAPFLAINCGALTENLLESELFGYEEGAFTGARKGGKNGLFELAHGGTLFLDEIGDTPRSIQVKLLRVLQEKEILRIGGNRTIPVDVRIIAATNQNLLELQRQGSFRQDLFYRLNALPLTMPPLRQRQEDIEPIFMYLLNKAQNQQKDSRPLKLDPVVITMLKNHSWPGNVRELENLVAYLLSIANIKKNLTDAVAELLAGIKDECSTKLPTRDFSNRKIKEECEAILRILLIAKNQGMAMTGRGDLQRQLWQAEKLSLSLDQIKLRLGTLRSFGYADARMGKGHYILPAGEEYIKR
jgi:transcriptional regulator with PAS, ATPase and Fis domain